MEEGPSHVLAPDSFQPYPDDLAERRSRWPVVFGAISLVVGVFGTCMQGGLAISIFGGDLMTRMSGLALPAPPQTVRTVGAITAAATVLLGIVLVVGAGLLLARRSIGARLVLAWAVLRLVVVVVSIATGILFLRPQVDWSMELVSSIRDQLREKGVKEEQLPPLEDRAAVETKSVRSIAIAALAFSLWPFTMAIVLTRPHVRNDLEAWRAAGR